MNDGQQISPPWLSNDDLQQLLALLNEGQGEAKVAGGAVRNAVLDEPVHDIDIATNLVPRDVILRCREAGLKTVPTGIEHGTVTVIVGDAGFEVTTLHHDVETDGRRAQIRFGTDWHEDARRRDFTLNALYLNADGTIFDPLDGIKDVLARRVRFIDDPDQRILEDHLRILRFFRFFAWYGAFRPDAEGLKACTRHKARLATLSAERVWQELSKLLAAPDPTRAILWMRQTGVLTQILPESEKWGIDGLAPYIAAEQGLNWPLDMPLRLMAIIPPHLEKVSALAERLKLPNKVANRLRHWAGASIPDPKWKKAHFLRWLYVQNQSAVSDRLRLEIAKAADTQRAHQQQLNWLEKWKQPVLPVKGADLLALGFEAGPGISKCLGELERQWVEADFKPTKAALLKAVTAEHSP